MRSSVYWCPCNLSLSPFPTLKEGTVAMWLRCLLWKLRFLVQFHLSHFLFFFVTFRIWKKGPLYIQQNIYTNIHIYKTYTCLYILIIPTKLCIYIKSILFNLFPVRIISSRLTEYFHSIFLVFFYQNQRTYDRIRFEFQNSLKSVKITVAFVLAEATILTILDSLGQNCTF